MVKVLAQRKFPVRELRLLASSVSAGKRVQFGDRLATVGELTGDSFEGVDIALFATEKELSKEFAPVAAAAGAVVVDNSSAFRLDPDCPLIVPEVNADALHRDARIIANPNCVAAILAVGINPLRRLAGFRRIVASTYQAASAARAKAMRELLDQSRAVLGGLQAEAKVFPYPIAFNLFSHDTPIQANGYNSEEVKVIKELQRLFGLPSLPISVTCIRVPVLRAHSISVNIEFDRPVSEGEVRAALMSAPGLVVQDDRSDNHFPMPIEVSGEDAVRVGRIRPDLSHPNAINLFIAGDQLLKGAALNAVQIAELVMAR